MAQTTLQGTDAKDTLATTHLLLEVYGVRNNRHEILYSNGSLKHQTLPTYVKMKCDQYDDYWSGLEAIYYNKCREYAIYAKIS
jgi:hypothetical protein